MRGLLPTATMDHPELPMTINEDNEAAISREEALRAYARMMNKLDADEMSGLLAPDFTYESQWVFDALRSRDEYLDYIRPKLETIARSGARVFAEMGSIRAFGGEQPCVVVAQGDPEDLVGVVLASVRGGQIARLDLCAVPPPSTAHRSGDYPGREP